MNTTIVVESEAPNVTEIRNILLDHFETLDKKKAELRTAKEMLDSVLQNDEGYRIAKKKEADIKKERMVKEAQLKDANPTPANKIDELREDIKEENEAITDYITEYVRLTNKMEITKRDGTEVKIVRRYKWMSPGQQKLL